MSALLWISAAQAAGAKSSAPAAATKMPKPAFSIDSKAHQIWLRAARLYGGLKTLQIAWKKRDSDPSVSAPSGHGPLVSNSTVSIDYQGFLKKLRFEMQQDGVQAQVVIDGETLALANSTGFEDMQSQISGITEVVPDAIKRKKVKVFIKKIDPNDGGAGAAIFSTLNDSSSDTATTLFRWLFGDDGLSEKGVSQRIEQGYYSSLRAITLPAQIFQGELCDLVRVTTLDNDLVPGKGAYLVQKTYWFAQKDGRLLRIQGHTKLGSGPASTSDLQVTKQDLAPQFSEQSWKFVPPTYASAK